MRAALTPKPPIAPELPAGRTAAWNIAFLAVETAGVLAAHYLFGVALWAIAATYSAVLAAGIAALVYVAQVAVPRARRRHRQALLAALATPDAAESERPATPVRTAAPPPAHRASTRRRLHQRRRDVRSAALPLDRSSTQ